MVVGACSCGCGRLVLYVYAPATVPASALPAHTPTLQRQKCSRRSVRGVHAGSGSRAAMISDPDKDRSRAALPEPVRTRSLPTFADKGPHRQCDGRFRQRQKPGSRPTALSLGVPVRPPIAHDYEDSDRLKAISTACRW